jgi:uncharacterized alkaline shock family protein YloU
VTVRGNLAAVPPDAAESTVDSSDLPDPADRGKLTIDPSVVRKVVEHSADLVPGTARAHRRLSADRGASARISGAGNDVDVRLDIALAYPLAVREKVAELRDTVTEEVERITGYHVRAVDVVVSALLPESHPRVR